MSLLRRQLGETLDQYAALLKQMRKKSDAAKIEARARILHGAPDTTAAPAAAKKKTR